MHKLFFIFLILIGLQSSFAQEDEELMEPETESQETNSNSSLPIKIDADKAIDAILASYRNSTEEDVEKVLKERISVLPFAKYIAEDSKLYLFLTRILRDEKAVPSMVALLKDRNRLLIFLGLNILIFIVGYMWKKRHQNTKDDVGIVGRMQRTFTRIIILQFARLILFIVYFNNEIKPFWEITKRTFL